MVNSRKIEIDKLYQKIDKIAKVGRDNYINYHIFVDELVRNGKYSLWVETLEIKYNILIQDLDVLTAKKGSWNDILFKTNSSFQELHKKLFKDKSIYQVGPYYYKQLPRARVTVVDTKGSGAELEPVISDGHIQSVNVIKPGLGYSASASVVFTGGLVTASASTQVVASKIYSVLITASGSNYNKDPKLGTIDEIEVYKNPIPNGATRALYQQLSENKTIQLVATIDGATQSATFSSWNTEKSFDKNLNSLYTSAIDYLLTSIV
jgi:hypothetical protein